MRDTRCKCVTLSIDTACLVLSGPCPADYPVTVRTGTLGKVACLAPGSSCPGDYNFGFYAPSADGKSAVLSNCFRRADIVVSTNPTCSVTIPAGSGPSGTTGSYSRPIRSNSTGTLELLGCMLDSISVCPTGNLQWCKDSDLHSWCVLGNCSTS